MERNVNTDHLAMTFSRVVEAKQTRAAVLADYAMSRAVREAEKDQREREGFDGKVSSLTPNPS